MLESAARRVENGVITLGHLPPEFLEAAGCLAQARAARRADGFESVLRETRGNLAETARRLGVDPKTVRRWARDRRIDLDGIRAEARQ